MRIAVIGAGPSGSRAAAGLAAAGHEVALIDRSFDREKPCGGGVPATGLRLLAEAWSGHSGAPGDARRTDPSSPSGACRGHGGFVVGTLRLEAPSGARARVDLPGPLAIFSRRVLDRSLPDAAARGGAG